MNNDYPSPAKKKKSIFFQPNIISVSVRFVILAALAALGWKMLSGAAISAFTAREYIISGLILLPAAAIVIELIVWGLKWTKDERVSELGLHIVRFAVILFAVMNGIFVMLSLDYTSQYRDNISTELTEQALAGRIYMQHAIGQSLDFNPKETGELKTALESMLISDSDTATGRNRCSVIYLFTDGQEVTYQDLGFQDPGESFDFVDMEHTIAAFSTSPDMLPSDDKELLSRVRNTGIVEFRNTGRKENGSLSAFSTVYTTTGRPVGVLEVRQSNNDLLNVFSFATLELFLRMAAFICLFSFGFYGVMQLLDIALRPRNFDKSRSVLSCGREAARPILFFVMLTASLPLTLLLFSSSLRETVNIPKLPQGVGNIAPAIIYLVGISLGFIMVKHTGARLTELPSNLALGITVFCNIALILMLDRDIAFLRPYNSYVTILALIFVSGVCYGISFSTIKKFQKQSDRLFGYDKYSYLCVCLGGITGTILGAVVMDYKGDLYVRVLMVIFSAVTTVMSIILLEDLDTTASPDYVRSGTSGMSPGVLIAAVPIAALLGFVWVYICEYIQNKGYGAASAAFCAVMPVIAFCFGNRLRLRTKGSRRAAVVVSILLAAASFIPLLRNHNPTMAAASALAASFAVIFASAGLYSALCKEERSRFMGAFLPLLMLSMVLFAMFMQRFNMTHSLNQLLFTAIACAGFAGLYLLMSAAADIRAKSAAKTTALATYGASSASDMRAIRESKKKKLPPPDKPALDSPHTDKTVANKPKAEKNKTERPGAGDNTDKKDGRKNGAAPFGETKPDAKPEKKPEKKPEDKKPEKKPDKPSDSEVFDLTGKNSGAQDSAPIVMGPAFPQTIPDPEPVKPEKKPEKVPDKKNDPLYTTPMDDGFASSPVFTDAIPVAPPPAAPSASTASSAPIAPEPPADDIIEDLPIIVAE